MERDSDNAEEKDEEEENEEEKHEEKEDEEKVDEQDKNADYGKEPRTIGQGEMENVSTDNADTIVHDEPTVLPEQGQDICKHTARPHPAGPAT
jgi:hypothetical protein